MVNEDEAELHVEASTQNLKTDLSVTGSRGLHVRGQEGHCRGMRAE